MSQVFVTMHGTNGHFYAVRCQPDPLVTVAHDIT
jgi:hypothetical protein